MSKIVLATLNARYTHSSLALYYLQAVLKQRGIKAVVCEFNINQPHLQILCELAAHQAGYYGFSVYIWNSEQSRRLIADLKQLVPQARFILGGPEVSYDQQNWLTKLPWLDHIVSGSGEKALLKIISDGNCDQLIDGEAADDLDELPFVYGDFTPEGLGVRYFYYETSRGCPFKCAYCLSSREDQRLRFRSLKLVYQELEHFIAQGYRHIKLVDRTFNADRQRARNIWHKILELYGKYPQSRSGFHFEIHPQFLEEEDFELLSQAPAGRFQIEAGIQTLNAEVMNTIKRHMDWQTVKKNLSRLIKMKNINLHLDLIAGLPGEDFKSLAAGFDEVLRLQARHLQLGFLKVLPGTQMADLAAEYGIIYENSAPYEVLQTSELSCQELATVREIEELLENYYNSGKYRITLAGLLEQEISGWEFFVKLAGHYKKADVDIHLRKWDKCARILYDHLRLQNLMPAAELLDRLRLDWCQQAKSHYYLDWLDSREMRSAKENGYQLLRKQKKLNNVLLSAAQMRQAIFWTAESSLAAKNEIWVFYGAAAHKNKLVLKQD